LKVYKDYTLKNFNSYQIDAKASKIYIPENLSEVEEFLGNIPHEKYSIVGAENSIIFSFPNYPTKQFIVLSSNLSKASVGENKITSMAWPVIKKVIPIGILCLGLKALFVL